MPLPLAHWTGLEQFTRIWAIDFEFGSPDGGLPEPRCVVARELRSGKLIRIWLDGTAAPQPPALDFRDDDLVVAFYSSAEIGCLKRLGWTLPKHVLDLYTEFRQRTNGAPPPFGSGLLGAQTYFGLDGLAAAEKESMRDLALRGDPYSDEERRDLLDYCQSDVDALGPLLQAMLPRIDVPRALLRGRYMCAAAAIEHVGIPMDVPNLVRLRTNWDAICGRLVEVVDQDYGVYDGTTFKIATWDAWLQSRKIPWPRLETGRLALDEDTFRQAAKRYLEVAPIHELRTTLGQMRNVDLHVGPDGRNRTLLSAFRAKTGRNQPSNSHFAFGPACWMRSLIRAEPGRALAYIDWSAQEIGIAAALSGDEAMMAAYECGDPYLWLAKAGGYAPEGATKKTHGSLREIYKVVYLAANYGMGEETLAQTIGQPPVYARELLRLHRDRFRDFWKWSEGALDCALLHGKLWTVFGWDLHVGPDARPTSLRNFPVQANGAEMLRLACCLATERGIRVCAPVHDALLVEGPVETIDEVVAETQQAMRDASRVVLGGFCLRSEAKIVRYPDRYSDPRGERLWAIVMGLLDELDPVRDGLVGVSDDGC